MSKPVALEYWELRFDTITAFCLMSLITIIIVAYSAILIETYAAFSLYGDSAAAFERLLSRQTPGEQVERIAGVKKYIALLGDAQQKDPGRAEIYFELGEFMHAVAGDPDMAAWIGTNDADNAQSLRRKAVGYYSRALERFPTNSVYQQRLGLVFQELGYSRLADEAYQRAEFLDPRNATLRLFLAQYYWQKPDLEKFGRQAEMVVAIYQHTLKGGGRFNAIKTNVEDFFASIHKKELLTQ